MINIKIETLVENKKNQTTKEVIMKSILDFKFANKKDKLMLELYEKLSKTNEHIKLIYSTTDKPKIERCFIVDKEMIQVFYKQEEREDDKRKT